MSQLLKQFSEMRDKYSATVNFIAQYSLLIFEGLILLGITLAFWYHIDPTQGLRDAWFWTLWLAVPIFGLRLWFAGRLWTHTPLHPVLIIFVLTAAYSYSHAAFQRESFLAPMGRPLLGIWTFIYFVELTRTTKSLKPVIVLMLGMSFCLGLLAFTSSQFLQAKTSILWNVIETLPRFDYRAYAARFDGQVCSSLVEMVHTTGCFNPRVTLSNAFLSFNVNEIAGALAWIIPVMAGFALMADSRGDDNQPITKKPFWIVIRGIAAIIFVIAFLSLFFGQSRFAIGGVLVSLIVLVFAGIKSDLWRYIALGVIGFVLLFQMGIMLRWFEPIPETSNETVTFGLSERDENSVATRLEIWDRSVRMMLDYPDAGIGMYMFRTAVSRDPYRIPYYVDNNKPSPPHSHNEWLNMGAEMGIPGFIIYIVMQLTVLWMLWRGWLKGDQSVRTVAMATFAGLLAHSAYGFGDTVALWDRFQFVLWWLVGLAGAQYVLMRLQSGTNIWDAGIETIDNTAIQAD